VLVFLCCGVIIMNLYSDTTDFEKSCTKVRRLTGKGRGGWRAKESRVVERFYPISMFIAFTPLHLFASSPLRSLNFCFSSFPTFPTFQLLQSSVTMGGVARTYGAAAEKFPGSAGAAEGAIMSDYARRKGVETRWGAHLHVESS
jgi:hypothetical protein